MKKSIICILVISFLLAFSLYAEETEEELGKDFTDIVKITNFNMYLGYDAYNGREVIKNGVLDPSKKDITLGRFLYISFNWTITDEEMQGAPENSYFKFQFMDPEYVNLIDSAEGAILDPEDTTSSIGTYKIDTVSGELTVILNDKGVAAGIENGGFNSVIRSIKKTEDKPYKVYLNNEQYSNPSATNFVTLNFYKDDNYNTDLMGRSEFHTHDPLYSGAFVAYYGGDKVIGCSNTFNLDQAENLYKFYKTGNKIEKREKVFIEELLSHKVEIVKDAILIKFFAYVPHIIRDSDTDPYHLELDDNGHPVISGEYIWIEYGRKNDVNQVFPEENETYEHFKNRIKNDYDEPTFGVYDNPDFEHSAAFLFSWGDSPGTFKKGTTETINYNKLLNKDSSIDLLKTKIDYFTNNTHEMLPSQADAMKQVFGLDDPSTSVINGQYVGASVYYYVKPKMSGKYSHTANMSYIVDDNDPNTEDEQTVTRTSGQCIYNLPGATGSANSLNLNIKKVFSDGYEKHKDENIKFRLYSSGDYTHEVRVVNKDNNWRAVFENLYRYVNNDIIEYTVKELNVPSGYRAKVEGNQEDGFIIYNNKMANKSFIISYYDENENSSWGVLKPGSTTIRWLLGRPEVFLEVLPDGTEKEFVYLENEPNGKPTGKIFKCWNTKLDGTGNSYAAGQKVYINEGDFILSSTSVPELYAIWEPYNFSISGFKNYYVYIDADNNPSNPLTFKGMRDGSGDKQFINWRAVNNYVYEPGFTDDTLVAIKGTTDDYGIVAGMVCKYKKEDGTLYGTMPDAVDSSLSNWYYLVSDSEPRDSLGNMYYSKYYASNNWKKASVVDIVENAVPYYHYVKDTLRWNLWWLTTPFRYIWSDHYFIDGTSSNPEPVSKTVYFRNIAPLPMIEAGDVEISPDEIKDKIYGEKMRVPFRYTFTEDARVNGINIRFLLRNIIKNDKRVADYFYPNIDSIKLMQGGTEKPFNNSFKVLKGIYAGNNFDKINLDKGYSILINSDETIDIKAGDYIEVVLVTDLRFNRFYGDDGILDNYCMFYSNSNDYSDMELPFEFKEKLAELIARTNFNDIADYFTINTAIRYDESGARKENAKMTTIKFENKSKFLGE